jgi:hypothetical protein
MSVEVREAARCRELAAWRDKSAAFFRSRCDPTATLCAEDCDTEAAALRAYATLLLPTEAAVQRTRWAIEGNVGSENQARAAIDAMRGDDDA